MRYLLITIIFGWTGAIISILITIVGLIKQKATWVAANVVIYLPFIWYLYSTPRFHDYVLLFPLLQLSAAVAIIFNKKELSWILVIPVIIFNLWLGCEFIIK